MNDYEKNFFEFTYIVTMQTKNNKRLYLTMHTTNGKPQWTFDKEDACIWNDERTCKKFCLKWFKKFKDYSIREYISEKEEKL